jgi:hypothetical protein
MTYISGFRSGFSRRDMLNPSSDEAERKRTARTERIAAELGHGAVAHLDEAPNVIDTSFDGLDRRLPDDQIPHLSPEEAIPAINADQPQDPRFN